MLAKHFIKRAFQRMVIRSLRHASSYNLNLKNDFENEVLQGCRNLINKSTTELSVCPDTGRKYIIDPDSRIKMVINGNKIIVSNNTHYREVPISERGRESINRVFNGHLRKSIAALDNNIKQNAQHTLNDVTILTNYL